MTQAHQTAAARRTRLAAALALALPGAAAAQGADTAGAAQGVTTRSCVAENGVSLTLSAHDTSGRAQRLALDSRTSIDTVYHLNIAERRWTGTDIAASLAAGVSGAPRRAGGAAASRARFTACVGVSIVAPRATLVLRQVKGEVRFRVALDSLARVLGATQPGSIRR